MKGPAKGFWAKLWQRLEAHVADVAAVTEALLKRTILRSRFGRLLEQEALSDVHIARLSVLAALHDVGKVNHGFQDYAYLHDHRWVGHVSDLADFMRWPDPEKEQECFS